MIYIGRLQLLCLTFASIFLLCLTVVNAETVNLSDGRVLELKQDGTYQFVVSDRSFEIVLLEATKPGQKDYFANKNRDCVLVFQVKNRIGGALLQFSGNIEVKNKSNMKVDVGSFSSINLGLFSDIQIDHMDSARSEIVAEENCQNISSVTLLSVKDKSCNYVGRKKDDTCFRLSNVKSNLTSIDFSKRR